VAVHVLAPVAILPRPEGKGQRARTAQRQRQVPAPGGSQSQSHSHHGPGHCTAPSKDDWTRKKKDFEKATLPGIYTAPAPRREDPGRSRTPDCQPRSALVGSLPLRPASPSSHSTAPGLSLSLLLLPPSVAGDRRFPFSRSQFIQLLCYLYTVCMPLLCLQFCVQRRSRRDGVGGQGRGHPRHGHLLPAQLRAPGTIATSGSRGRKLATFALPFGPSLRFAVVGGTGHARARSPVCSTIPRRARGAGRRRGHHHTLCVVARALYGCRGFAGRLLVLVGVPRARVAPSGARDGGITAQRPRPVGRCLGPSLPPSARHGAELVGSLLREPYAHALLP
jgi:hypothetical protein